MQCKQCNAMHKKHYQAKNLCIEILPDNGSILYILLNILPTWARNAAAPSSARLSSNTKGCIPTGL